jgi:hypothetical protein
MDASKIAAAVEACLRQAQESERPFRAINDFLSLLKREGWDEGVRLEVQTRILEELKRRRGGQSSA